MKKKHYLIYKTTCLMNGKIYIGQHQTYDPNDDYLGSGRDLKDDIRKFGSENFKRETLFDFETQKEMNDKEKELVTEDFINREDTYNVRLGGQNPNISDTYKFGRDGFKRRLRNKVYRDRFCNKIREALKRRWKEHPEQFSNCCVGKFPNTFLGKHHTEKTKQKIREKNSIILRGEHNGSFGTVWIYNESLEQNKKVKKEEAEIFLKQGWKLGRKMSFNK